MSTLRETCSCGATFEYESLRSDYGTPATAAKEWRKTHRHEFPPPLADQILPSDELSREAPDADS